jgi:hypothetical protein
VICYSISSGLVLCILCISVINFDSENCKDGNNFKKMNLKSVMLEMMKLRMRDVIWFAKVYTVTLHWPNITHMTSSSHTFRWCPCFKCLYWHKGQCLQCGTHKGFHCQILASSLPSILCFTLLCIPIMLLFYPPLKSSNHLAHRRASTHWTNFLYQLWTIQLSFLI